MTTSFAVNIMCLFSFAIILLIIMYVIIKKTHYIWLGIFQFLYVMILYFPITLVFGLLGYLAYNYTAQLNHGDYTFSWISAVLVLPYLKSLDWFIYKRVSYKAKKMLPYSELALRGVDTLDNLSASVMKSYETKNSLLYFWRISNVYRAFDKLMSKQIKKGLKTFIDFSGGEKVVYYVTSDKLRERESSSAILATNILDEYFKQIGLISDEKVRQLKDTLVNLNDTELKAISPALFKSMDDIVKRKRLELKDRVLQKYCCQNYINKKLTGYINDSLNSVVLNTTNGTQTYYVHNIHLEHIYEKWQLITCITKDFIIHTLEIRDDILLIQEIWQYLVKNFGRSVLFLVESQNPPNIYCLNLKVIQKKWEDDNIIPLKEFMSFFRIKDTAICQNRGLLEQLGWEYIVNYSDPLKKFYIKNRAIKTHYCAKCHEIYSVTEIYQGAVYCESCIKYVKADTSESKISKTRKAIPPSKIPPKMMRKLQEQMRKNKK